MSQQRRQRSFSAKFKLGGLSAPPMNKKRSPLCVIICSLMKWRRWSTRPAIAPPARTPAHLFHSPYVFVSERKAPLSPRSIREIVARTGRLAGLPFVPIPTNSGMRAAITWHLGGMIPGPFRIIWGIRTFSIPYATPPWRPTDSNASGRIKPCTTSREALVWP
jgi:hypothetical protein